MPTRMGWLAYHGSLPIRMLLAGPATLARAVGERAKRVRRLRRQMLRIFDHRSTSTVQCNRHLANLAWAFDKQLDCAHGAEVGQAGVS